MEKRLLVSDLLKYVSENIDSISSCDTECIMSLIRDSYAAFDEIDTLAKEFLAVLPRTGPPPR
ncbi:MAG: hypothetical protein ACXADF_13830, partial [Candidatus Thorarchaeota archaeon]|jgi:hypothetical protein